MDDIERKMLESGWTPELLAMVKRPPEMTPTDLMFLNRAKEALQQAGYSALDFLAANPHLSTPKLAQRLNRGASALGLVIAIYDEAVRKNVVRETAKDLLIRTIHEEFPEGWSSGGNVGPAVKLGSWDYKIGRYILDSPFGCYAASIAKHLAIDHPPSEGWKPEWDKDPLIEELFDRYWPVK
jgi:hypothetical protein